MKMRELTAALKTARALINPDMTVQELLLFTMIAEAGQAGIDQATLILRSGAARSSVSRFVINMTAVTAKKERGPDLVVNLPDPSNLSARIVRITAKGQRVAAELLGEKS